MSKRAQEEGEVVESNLLLSGFDVIISPSEDIPDAYHVILEEGGSQVYETDIPISLDEFEGDNEDLDGSDALLEEVGKAAIDLFEAERGTLGQGAGATDMAARTKRACFESMYWEEWYYNLKGTQYEDEATNLLEQYLRSFEPDQYQSDFAEDLYIKIDEIYHQMDMLNFERMKTSEPEQIFVLVQGRAKKSFYDHLYIEEYLDKFINHNLEAKAVELVKQLLDVEVQIDNQINVSEEKWKERENLQNAMQELSMVALQADLEARTPEIESPIEVAPNMAADIAELMEGVDLEEPIEPLEEDEFSVFGRKTRGSFEYGFDYADILEDAKKLKDFPYSREKALEVLMDGYGYSIADKEKVEKAIEETYGGRYIIDLPEMEDKIFDSYEDAYQELKDYYWEEAESQAFRYPDTIRDVDTGEIIEELAEFIKKAEKEDEDKEEKREVEQRGDESGLDPAEREQEAFNANERIQLKKEVEVSLWGGMKKKYPAGTKGYAESAFDKNGDFYLMRLDDGKMIRVKYTDIKSIKK